MGSTLQNCRPYSLSRLSTPCSLSFFLLPSVDPHHRSSHLFSDESAVVRPTFLFLSEPLSFIHSFFLQHRLLDKTDASPIPGAYTSSASNASSQSATALTVRYCLYNTLAVQKQPARSLEPVRSPSPLDPSMLLESEPARVGMQTACAMPNAGRPALVATLSSLITTINVYLPSFGDVLGVLQALVRVVGCLVLPTPSGALLTAPSKAVSRHALWLHSKNH